MYPREVSIDEWIDLLSISHRYLFDDIHQLAIAQIGSAFHKLSTVRRIVLANKYEVTDWLKDAYVELALRDADLLYTLATEEYSRHFCFARSTSCSRGPVGLTTPCSRRNSRRRDSSQVSKASALRLANATWALPY